MLYYPTYPFINDQCSSLENKFKMLSNRNHPYIARYYFCYSYVKKLIQLHQMHYYDKFYKNRPIFNILYFILV